MRRREFLGVLGGAAGAAWPLVALAQESNAGSRAAQILQTRADAIANQIDRFIEDIKTHVEPYTQMTDVVLQRFEVLHLLRQIPALIEVERIDSGGKGQQHVSRLPMMTPEAGIDLSKAPKFTEALVKQIYYGPVHFRKSSDDRATSLWTLSIAGPKRDAGVSVFVVSLESVQSAVNSTRVGDHGRVYVLDSVGTVIAHTDSSQQQRDFSQRAQVQAARRSGSHAQVTHLGRDSDGREILSVGVGVPRPNLGWLVFVELPVEEANALPQ